MEIMDTVKLLVDLGMTGVLLYFLVVLWKEKKESSEKKDNRIKELSDSVLNVVRENTKVQTELTGEIKASIKASETLTQAVYEALRKGGK